MFPNNFWSVYDRVDEAKARQRRAHYASIRGRLRLQQRVEELEDDLARVALLTMALAKLCVDKGVLTADELNARMSEIDLADGTEDGKAPPEAFETGAAASP